MLLRTCPKGLLLIPFSLSQSSGRFEFRPVWAPKHGKPWEHGTFPLIPWQVEKGVRIGGIFERPQRLNAIDLRFTSKSQCAINLSTRVRCFTRNKDSATRFAADHLCQCRHVDIFIIGARQISTVKLQSCGVPAPSARRPGRPGDRSLQGALPLRRRGWRLPRAGEHRAR
jgi:hypothetical protein